MQLWRIQLIEYSRKTPKTEKNREKLQILNTSLSFGSRKFMI